jgi:hypothetical protein
MFVKSWMKWVAVGVVPAMTLAAMPVVGQARTGTTYAAMSVTPPLKSTLHKKARTLAATHKLHKALIVKHKSGKSLAVTHKKPVAHHALTKSSKHTGTKLSKLHKTKTTM